jgi:bifunctional ADP-heptose synthase (sugar kinase/adenylyltransferase)
MVEFYSILSKSNYKDRILKSYNKGIIFSFQYIIKNIQNEIDAYILFEEKRKDSYKYCILINQDSFELLKLISK